MPMVSNRSEDGSDYVNDDRVVRGKDDEINLIITFYFDLTYTLKTLQISDYSRDRKIERPGQQRE